MREKLGHSKLIISFLLHAYEQVHAGGQVISYYLIILCTFLIPGNKTGSEQRRLHGYINNKMFLTWWLVFTVFTLRIQLWVYIWLRLSLFLTTVDKWMGSQQNSIGAILGHNTSCRTYTSGISWSDSSDSTWESIVKFALQYTSITNRQLSGWIY